MFSTDELQVKTIPFSNFKERLRITKQELEKGKKIIFDEEHVYSSPKEIRISKHVKFKRYRSSEANKEAENFKCNSCDMKFRIVALDDVQWAICPRCGGVNIDNLKGKEEMDFENNIK